MWLCNSTPCIQIASLPQHMFQSRLVLLPAKCAPHAIPFALQNPSKQRHMLTNNLSTAIIPGLNHWFNHISILSSPKIPLTKCQKIYRAKVPPCLIPCLLFPEHNFQNISVANCSNNVSGKKLLKITLNLSLHWIKTSLFPEQNQI